MRYQKTRNLVYENKIIVHTAVRIPTALEKFSLSITEQFL